LKFRNLSQRHYTNHYADFLIRQTAVEVDGVPSKAELEALNQEVFFELPYSGRSTLEEADVVEGTRAAENTL
jgi:hypothetical protein